jgi:UTP:GlnB (protein PII) uridylyltransferase
MRRVVAVKASPAVMQHFVAELPASYRAAFGWETIGEHAELWSGRPASRARVGFCVCPRFDGHCLFVVADDRPGLLAILCAAMVEQRLDVTAAEAYTRGGKSGKREAIDVFWVRRVDRLHQETVLDESARLRIEQAINQRLEEESCPPTPRPPSVFPAPAGGSASAVVRFLENRAGNLSTLEVEASDRIGLLLVLSRTLTKQNVQIVSSRVRTEAGQIRDSFEITELDDSPIGPDRRLAIQVAVLSALS